MVRQITLTRGMVTVVDDADFEWLVRFKWQAVPGRRGSFYASRSDGRRSYQMQREILDPECRLGRTLLADHINGDTLDNRRENLRLVDNVVSGVNRRIYLNNVTGYRGVSFSKYHGKYQAIIRINGVAKNLGRFDCPNDAASAFNKAAIESRGANAKLNVVPTKGDANDR